MNRYKTRPGVVSAMLCGQFTLIPTRAIYDVCGTLQMVPPKWVPLWRMVEHGEPMERIYAFYRPHYRDEPGKADRSVDFVLEKLWEKGFLVREAGEETP